MEIGLFDAVVFDFDGTLADSHAAMVRAYTRWFTEYGITGVDLAQFTGMPTIAIAAQLLPAQQVAEATARMEQLEVADLDGVVPLPGAVAALAALPDTRRAIATSCTRPLIEARLAATGLERPAVVISRDDVTAGKPAPDSFLAAARQLGVAPGACLVLEDAPAGVQAARAAGMSVVGLTTNHAPVELAADHHVADLSALTFSDTPNGVQVALVTD